MATLVSPQHGKEYSKREEVKVPHPVGPRSGTTDSTISTVFFWLNNHRVMKRRHRALRFVGGWYRICCHIFLPKYGNHQPNIWLCLCQVTISGQIIMAGWWLHGSEHGFLCKGKDKNIERTYLLSRNVVMATFLRRIHIRRQATAPLGWVGLWENGFAGPLSITIICWKILFLS